MSDERNEILLTLTADIVSAHVAANSVSISDLPALISNVHKSLAGLGQTPAAPKQELRPAVSVRASVKPDYLVCLEDGVKAKMLKRHLRNAHGLSPDEYRAKWGLPKNYPMTAPEYSETRRGLAVSLGLGRKKPNTPPSSKPKG